jgi:hypothetical protein
MSDDKDDKHLAYVYIPSTDGPAQPQLTLTLLTLTHGSITRTCTYRREL